MEEEPTEESVRALVGKTKKKKGEKLSAGKSPLAQEVDLDDPADQTFDGWRAKKQNRRRKRREDATTTRATEQGAEESVAQKLADFENRGAGDISHLEGAIYKNSLFVQQEVVLEEKRGVEARERALIYESMLSSEEEGGLSPPRSPGGETSSATAVEKKSEPENSGTALPQNSADQNQQLPDFDPATVNELHKNLLEEEPGQLSAGVWQSSGGDVAPSPRLLKAQTELLERHFQVQQAALEKLNDKWRFFMNEFANGKNLQIRELKRENRRLATTLHLEQTRCEKMRLLNVDLGAGLIPQYEKNIFALTEDKHYLLDAIRDYFDGELLKQMDAAVLLFVGGGKTADDLEEEEQVDPVVAENETLVRENRVLKNTLWRLGPYSSKPGTGVVAGAGAAGGGQKNFAETSDAKVQYLLCCNKVKLFPMVVGT